MTPKPKPVKHRKPPRKVVEKQLEAMAKQIIFWRDGSECVERFIDPRCRPGIQWGHVVPQGKSPKLVYSLSNVFPQCPNHNLLHNKKDPVYNDWYVRQFGARAYNDLCQFQRDNIGTQYCLWELENMLERYDELFENHFYVGLSIEELVAAGYYGEIIQAAWKSEGRI